MFATALPEDHYGRMLKALDNPDEFKRQLQTMADQNEALRISINEQARIRTEVEAKTKDLEFKALELQRHLDDINSKLELHAQNKLQHDKAVAEMNEREASVSKRERLVSDREETVKADAKKASDKHAEASSMHDTAKKLHQEATQLKSDYEAKLASLKAMV